MIIKPKIIEAFNSTSRVLDDLLNIDNPYFEGMVNQIYPPELQLNKANTSDTEAPFLIYIFLFLTVLLPPKFMINAMTLILILLIFPFWMGIFHVVSLIVASHRANGRETDKKSFHPFVSGRIRFKSVSNPVNSFLIR